MIKLAIPTTLMIVLAVIGGCHSSEPTREYLARATYARIAADMNVLLKGDYLGWFDETDDLERTQVQ